MAQVKKVERMGYAVFVATLLFVFSLIAACGTSTDSDSNQHPETNNGGAYSAMQIEMTLEELIDMSDLIVTGTITGYQSYWNDEETLIFTNYSLAVNQYLKFNDDNEIIIRELGGLVGDIGQEGGDGPDLSRGENVLLFLKRNADCTFSVAGGSQGKYVLNEYFEPEDPEGISFMASLKDILIEKED